MIKGLHELTEENIAPWTEKQRELLHACTDLEQRSRPLDKRVSSAEAYKLLIRTLHQKPRHNNRAYSKWMLAFVSSQIGNTQQLLLWAYTLERIRADQKIARTHPITMGNLLGAFPHGFPKEEAYVELWTPELEDNANWEFSLPSK